MLRDASDIRQRMSEAGWAINKGDALRTLPRHVEGRLASDSRSADALQEQHDLRT